MPAPSVWSKLPSDAHDRATRHSQNIVDVPTDLSTPFDYLTNSDTNAGQRWPVWAWYCKSNFWLHLYEAAVHRADVRTHMGGTSRAGEGVESWNGTTSGNKQAAVV
jgi:hypothetical protein